MAICPFASSRVQASATPGFEPGRVAIGDFDGDSGADLAVAGFYATPDQRTVGEVDVLFNHGHGAFVGPATATLPMPENTCGISVAPFGGSLGDAIAACAYDAPVQIFHDAGQGNFVAGVSLAGAPYPQAMAAADFDRDGRPDVVVAEQDQAQIGGPSASLVTFLNRGGGAFTSSSLPEPDASALPAALLAGDIDGDGHLDLVGLPYVSELRPYLGQGDGSFSALPPLAIPQPPRGGALADVDGDGRLDLVLALQDGSARLYVGDGAGGFRATTALPAGPQSADVAVADFDGDGRPDVAVTDYDGGTVAIFPGLGGGGFGAPATCAAGYFPEALAAGDLDGDGAPDLVSVDEDGQVDVLLYRGPHR